MKFTLHTTVPNSRIQIDSAKLFSPKTSRSFGVSIAGNALVYGWPITGQVLFQSSHNGRHEDRVEIVFEDEGQRFAVVRSLRAIVGSKTDHGLLKPTAPFVRKKKITREPEKEIFEGVPPPALKAIPYVVKLARSDIPIKLSAALSTGSTSDIIGRVRRMFLPNAWESSTYSRHFKHLIWIEEYKMESDLDVYDIFDATLTKHGLCYRLEVPGLTENRPSVLVGDQILVHRHGGPPGQWFEGRVHLIRQLSVDLRFHGSFSWSASQRYNVRFKLNRHPLRRQHQALDVEFAQDRVLIPLRNHLRQLDNVIPRLKVFNKLIASNAPQLQAVSSVVRQKPGTVPFVIFGPPGTGKTITVVEAIRQILVHHPKARILACAPSNSAADLIASRLVALGNDTLFRFYAPSCHKDQVPGELQSFVAINKDGHFTIPPMAQLKSVRVIVTTCVSASFAYGVGLPRGHFSHLFFDEAGQATEPEVMIAIKTIADKSTNIILSGDPKQLGPIIHSSVARELGLEKSYLERLMDCEIYKEKNGSAVVKLVKNFRSHNAILKFPNERFYDGELQQYGDRKIIDAFIGSPQLASKKFPVVFHAIFGKDDREASSPSFFNIDEITQVKTYVQALCADKQYHITDEDIGVISPYHAQCRKIRESLKAIAGGIKVGSVEEFQGQERTIIIISTVRSSREFVQYDLKHTLGFVANPRRFNVAVTRAKALLIIVGDPAVLSLDPLWRSFLNYVHINKGWKGPPPHWDTSAPVMEGGYGQELREAGLADMNDFTRRMESLTLTGVDSDSE
jgi:helicase MOV-10